MKTIVITGGNGDIAQSIKKELENEYIVLTPGKEELDVTDIKRVNEYFNSQNADILINNAGYVVPYSIGDCDIYSEKKAIDINLFGTFNCTAAVLEKNAKAKIINIGSSAASKVHGTWSSYCAAKAGVVMATMCWADDGYDVVCISPGRTATKMRKGLYPDEDQKTLLVPEDFAKVIRKAINGDYEKGSHINVTKQNVGELLND
jgi:3-oxoacyl-[acyl-carrier protein] reductase